MRCDGCPGPADQLCWGEDHRRLCELRLTRPDYAALLARPIGIEVPAPEPASVVLGEISSPAVEVYVAPRVDRFGYVVDPDLLPLVLNCPQRGGVLPLSQQADCGCAGEQGAELSECRAGRGAMPGRVTLRECLACQAETTRFTTGPVPPGQPPPEAADVAADRGGSA